MNNFNSDGKKFEREYERIQLTGQQSKYICIPSSIIIDNEMDVKSVSALSYLRVRCGLDNIINFTIPDMVEWCGMKPNNRDGKINCKFLDVLDLLSDKGYLTYLTKKSKSSYMKCKFNMDYYSEECSNGFVAIYLDEIEKIMSFQKVDSNSGTIMNINVFLVFAYLRNKIYRRPNELKPEERTLNGIQNRRKRLPEAYDDTINNIANVIGLSSKTLSKAIDILEYDLELIVTDRAYRVKNKDNEFRTPSTIFANAYKREDRYLLITGNDYSRTEIELKAKNIPNYKIDKSKRKTVCN